MSRRRQLRQEAAQVRGQIDRRADLIRLRINSLIHRVRALARSPVALPIAFVCGMLAGYLRVPGIKRVYRLLAHLTSQVKALQIAYRLIRSSSLSVR